MWKNISYKDIIENKYIINEYGVIKNIQSGEFLKCNNPKNNKGYARISLSTNTNKGIKSKKYFVHRIVMAMFVGDSNLEVNHKDGNKLNNNLSNLEYATRLENAQHAKENGYYQIGEERYNNIFSNLEIHLICYLFSEGKSIPYIIEKLNLPKNHNTIVYLNRIMKREYWTHISILYKWDNDSIRYKTYSKKDILEFIDLLDNGFKISDIIEKFPNYNSKKLKNILKKIKQGKLYNNLKVHRLSKG